MTSKQAQALVEQAYPLASEERFRAWHSVFSGPNTRKRIGGGETSAQAWKDAARRVQERFPQLVGAP